jgi:hypothetical protein
MEKKTRQTTLDEYMPNKTRQTTLEEWGLTFDKPPKKKDSIISKLQKMLNPKKSNVDIKSSSETKDGEEE